MTTSNPVADAFDTFNIARLQSPTLERIWRTAYGQQYGAEARPNAFYTQAVLDEIVSKVALCIDNSSSAPLLDVGCGHGLVGRYIAGLLGCSLVGVDISPKSIDLARRLSQEKPSESREVQFFVGNAASSIELSGGSCQAVVCLDVLLYFPDKLAALREMARVLKPGGLFAFTSWEAQGFNERIGAQQIEDYRPLIKEAGMEIQTYEALAQASEMQLAFFNEAPRHIAQLEEEMGIDPATNFLNMVAAASREAPNRRYVLGVARRL
ncbi:hypothetical protein ANO11243_056280 [Dothideomycetidae sp. 11243]|nr:hypothetical protein ANO11243_056280 [fungal sp. No.11243]